MKKKTPRITATIKTEILNQYSQYRLKSSKKKKAMKWCQPHHHRQMERHKPDVSILTRLSQSRNSMTQDENWVLGYQALYSLL